MANETPGSRIQIRNGTTNPQAGDLLPNELGYQKETGMLYIGQDNGAPVPLFGFTEDGKGNITFVLPKTT